MIDPRLYTGTHLPGWLWSGQVDFPLFVSHRRLSRHKNLHPACVQWALDSGGYSELSLFGEWRTSPREYAEATARYDREMGRLEWAAPQDHMCEAHILAKTGLTAAEHQRRTVENFLELGALWPQFSDEDDPYMPVLQAKPGDADGYLRHAGMYAAAGVHLADYPVVGVGTVCRVQETAQIGRIARALRPLDLALHWFGVKMTGLPGVWPPEEFADSLTSFDSMSWSFGARHMPRLPGCQHRGSCANCSSAASQWRDRVLVTLSVLERRGSQDEQEGAL